MAGALIEAGWDVHLVATPSAAAWVDEAALVETVGHTPTTGYRAPGEPHRGGRSDAVVVAPATFNTINKLAAGIADSYAHGLLCDALGTATPLVIAPMVNNRLWGHPIWTTNLQALSTVGVRFVDVRSGNTQPAPVQSGTGDQVVAAFDPQWVIQALAAAARKS
jgi:phosphopantothenoylcysteine decarboxylase